MDKVIVMQEFYSLDHLISNHANGFQRKLPFAKGKEILKTWPK
jgi:hypothetical protein